MKLIHIIGGKPNGGAEKFCEDLVSSLSRRGVDQHIITRPYEEMVSLFMNLGCTVSTLRLLITP